MIVEKTINPLINNKNNCGSLNVFQKSAIFINANLIGLKWSFPRSIPERSPWEQLRFAPRLPIRLRSLDLPNLEPRKCRAAFPGHCVYKGLDALLLFLKDSLGHGVTVLLLLKTASRVSYAGGGNAHKQRILVINSPL
uniref:Uncharacterized protein n=1 Tax=Molossus molossus TaxID=27622 RepID=A0A7J8JVM8_MOLMO|nr:hypothetical protein HJG59_007941 [Molossus molossus]